MGTLLSAPLIANAGELRIGDRDYSISFYDHSDKAYEVFYRRHHHDDWEYYGSYDSRYRAEKIAFNLRRQGYRTYIERH
ncbi:MAG: hypothetical protein HC790_13125 [Acaryochloridaceae cyanobacterium CSU_3_4]|nr:hypothetical protein [Acaryochloris sp. SU_5_25]NJN39420.1 hypothetical protein [Acaryochloridaceae cyanobacterium CSU_3_4]